VYPPVDVVALGEMGIGSCGYSVSTVFEDVPHGVAYPCRREPGQALGLPIMATLSVHPFWHLAGCLTRSRLGYDRCRSSQDCPG